MGRCFVGPWFDALLIGGGLSLPVLALVLWGVHVPGLAPIATGLEVLAEPAALPYVVLLLSSTHFAASTVRLYTKPGTSTALPFLTMAFPLIAFAVLTLCMLRPASLGANLQSLYLTWSPYHYAAQAYGVAMVYGYRSGCAPTDVQKRVLRWIALLPFFYAFVATSGAGLDWLLPASVQGALGLGAVVAVAKPILVVAGIAGPLAVAAASRRSGWTGPLPWISVMALLANGVWWFVLPARQAFVWATFFHGIQYLAIVLIFHVKEQMARPENTGSPLYHVVWFYGACLVLAFALFNCLPQAYALAGFSLTESLLLVVAAINLHHFVVDAFIWRLGRRDTNRAIVESGTALAPAA